MNDTTSKTSENGSGNGFCGKILNVDLSSGTPEYESLEESFYKKYLSGVGLGVKVLWDRIKPGIDPLGPENILGFSTGLLTDTNSLFTGRFMVVGKSPQTGGWGDSNCGGNFSPALKRCGVDAIFFYGASEKPVYVYMDENTIEINDASELWGQDAIETENILKEKHGKRAQVMCIGPAGEKLSLLAGISTDGGRLAGRSGLGSVMGSKKLKAVVVAGKQKAGVFDKDQMAELTKAYRSRLQLDKEPKLSDKMLGFGGKMQRILPFGVRTKGGMVRDLFRQFGTSGTTALSAESGDSPIKNWGGIGCKDFPLERSQKIGAETVIKYQVKKYGCFSCPIRCGGIMEIKEGPYPISEMHKPEYETLCSFGSLLLNDDIFSIFKINDMVNRGGIDSISCGATVAFAIECFENNIITEADTGGLKLAWGNSAAIIKLTEMIINREGIGDTLADGVKRAAEKIGKGATEYAVHCGGVEPGMHDPKFDNGQAISYYCDATPGRHTTAANLYLEIQELEKKYSRAKKVPSFITRKEKRRCDNKAEGIAVNIFFKMLMDGAGICLFGTQVGGEMPIAEWLNAATGWELSDDDYLVIGERINQLRHAFNIREGINPIKDFKPHPRVYGDPPQEKGPFKKLTLDIDMLAESYYDTMNWDVTTGKANKNYLERLDLKEVIDGIYPESKA